MLTKLVSFDFDKNIIRELKTLLRETSFNITKELGFLIYTFEDFSRIAQIREEIEKGNL